ncbi:chloramphenicol acetyltransferase [Pedobacter frigiditerrae]|uniref:Chloramphenicol acetyltransferase n=1 Tax=Pedobacter frigiditerrae TaxID=2530452 RepID=A0A4R0MN30_9SPHI|nr:chloramphenicol acetyltransferase [Pedobacter frigiditerrae]TCC88140.1 chloramphenicol acetyltransferase [Pedobacter frigiditerrae]
MKQLFDLENWVRKDHFNFFNRFEEPFFGVVVDIDCTIAYNKCKKEGIRFFLYYLHQALSSANAIENFRLRIEDDQIYIYNQVNASAVINRPDGTFGFSYIDYSPDFEEFQSIAKKEIERVQNSTGLVPAGSGDNVIHISAMPWLKFTSLSHARSFSFKDSCPKFSFGKMTEIEDRKSMPVSIHINHALADGYHVSLFVDEFQKRMNKA